jgi:hypothetical protein
MNCKNMFQLHGFYDAVFCSLNKIITYAEVDKNSNWRNYDNGANWNVDIMFLKTTGKENIWIKLLKIEK